MPFPLSTAQATRLEFLDECGSTNTELVTRAADAWPDFSVLATANQTAGRGRLGRVWVAPAGQTLAASVLLRPSFGADSYGWLPLVAGLAMARAVGTMLPSAALRSGKGRLNDPLERHFPDRTAEDASATPLPELGPTLPVTDDAPASGVRALGSQGGVSPVSGASTCSATGAVVTIKWPNDVQIDGLKVAGLLAELLPSADGVVIGAGLNLTIPADGLPTPTSTSLLLHGGDTDIDRVLAAYLRELKDLYLLLQQHGGDAEAAGIRRRIEHRCSTVGQQVRVELPGGATRYGEATGIDEHGRLVYIDRADASVQTVAAGDVTHLRYE